MKDVFYGDLIEHLPNGYSYHKVLYDKDGNPVNYIFLDVNKSFEKITGLNRENILNKKVTEVIPNIEKDSFNWIGKYGQVALSGESISLRQYSERLKHWYDVLVFSPEKDYFVTVFNDITEEVEKNEALELISKLIYEDLNIGINRLDYNRITDTIIKITKAKVVILNLYNEDLTKISTKSISASREDFAKIANFFSTKLIDKSYDVWDNKYYFSGLSNYLVFDSIFDGSSNYLPKELAKIIEKSLNIGKNYIFAMKSKSGLIGNLSIVMELGQDLGDLKIVEIISNQVALLIERSKNLDELISKEKELDTFFNSSLDLLCIANSKGEFIRLNPEWERVLGYRIEDLIGKRFMTFVHPDDISLTLSNIERITDNVENDSFVNRYICKDKTIRWIEWRIRNIKGKLYVSGRDITRQKEFELLERERLKEIEYISYHDHLTGLYNRRFFEAELERLDVERNLPISIIMADLNGLKLLNDSMGHTVGDKLLVEASKIFSKACRSDDIIARIGGDEFAFLLPLTNEVEAQDIINRMEILCANKKVEDIEVSVSFGLDTKIDKSQLIHTILKNAEDRMYTNKLYSEPSVRSRTIDNIVNAINNKSKIEERHSKGVSELCYLMALAMDLDDQSIKEYRTFGLLHDIGKIAIRDEILNKPSSLTELEYGEVQRHSEIGYRILSTAEGMAKIAEYVLYHHERWDGKGYPKGIGGDKIPLASRVCAIVESFESITNDRPFAKARSIDFAIKEIRNNSGTQYDPDLVDLFISQVIPQIK